MGRPGRGCTGRETWRGGEEMGSWSLWGGRMGRGRYGGNGSGRGGWRRGWGGGTRVERRGGGGGGVVEGGGEGGERRVVGYGVRRRSEAGQEQARAAHIGEWRELYESVYGESGEWGGDFNLAGWESSYTGEAIAAEEMRIWVEETVAHLRRLGPRRV